MTIKTFIIALSAIFAAIHADAQVYTTLFPLTENPISENGIWINGGQVGVDWSDVSTTPAYAVGQQIPDSGNFNDSTALLTGVWGPDQTVQVTVVNSSPSNDPGQYPSIRELEIRLRSTLTAHNCTGYEVYWSAQPLNPYLSIARWNGPLNSYENLGQQANGVTMNTGDVFAATIVGNTITAYINGVPKLQVTDSTFNSGNPGIGFYLGNTGGQAQPADSQFGFSSFTATATGGSGPVATPTPTPQPTPEPTPTPTPDPTPVPTPTASPSPTDPSDPTPTPNPTPRYRRPWWWWYYSIANPIPRTAELVTNGGFYSEPAETHAGPAKG